VVLLDHWKDVYLSDLLLCEKLQVFHEGSIISADNTDYPGAPDYVKYVKRGGSGLLGATRYAFETLVEPRIIGENESVRHSSSPTLSVLTY
jgi:catechol O-methyltransferase